MKMLPVALQIEGWPCLVVGGGSVGTRKVQSLLDCGALVTVVSPELSAEIAAFGSEVTVHQREFQPGDCAGFRLAFACTNNRAVNEAVTREAQRSGVLCNAADAPAESDFLSMARIERGDITVGISTQGGSPALARHLRERVEDAVGQEYGVLLRLLAERRALVIESVREQSLRGEIWRALLDSDVLLLLREGDEIGAIERINAIHGEIIESREG